jgi:hypothetical protein
LHLTLKDKPAWNSVVSLFQKAVNSENPQDVINSNISVINLMRGRIDDDLIHDALMSYYLDYYTSQYTEGNFAQFVYNPIGTRN